MDRDVLGASILTYIISGETEVAGDLGFEYAVLPQVSVGAICCFCNLHEKKKTKKKTGDRKKHHAEDWIKLMYVCHECVAFASSPA